MWSEAYIPKLLFKPKWFKNETDLKVGDLVYFQKSESELGSPWMLGMIAVVERSRAGLIRKVDIKYRNASEQQDRTSYRNVRNICKIWSEDDWNLQDDLAELAAKLKEIQGELDGVQPQVNFFHQAAQLLAGHPVHVHSEGHVPDNAVDGCCCEAHCSLLHDAGSRLRSYQALLNIQHVPCELQPEVPRFKRILEQSMEEQGADTEPTKDNLTDYLLNLNNA